MMRHKNNKKGWISFEFIIVSAIVVTFSAMVFYKWFPTNLRKVRDEAGSYMTVFLPKENTSAPSVGASDQFKPATPGATTDASDYTFSITGNVATITDYKGSATNVVIPDTLSDGTNTGTVMAIADNAFKNKGLTGVSIPDTVTTIGSYAFANNELTTLSLPSSVTSIKDHAFSNNKITSLSIPSGVTVVSSYAFQSNRINRLNINGSVTEIQDGAFKDNELSKIDVPDTVEKIGKSAFADNYLTTIIISNKCYQLGDSAFKSQTVEKTFVTVLSSASLDAARFDENWSTYFDDTAKRTN